MSDTTGRTPSTGETPEERASEETNSLTPANQPTSSEPTASEPTMRQPANEDDWIATPTNASEQLAPQGDEPTLTLRPQPAAEQPPAAAAEQSPAAAAEQPPAAAAEQPPAAARPASTPARSSALGDPAAPTQRIARPSRPASSGATPPAAASPSRTDSISRDGGSRDTGASNHRDGATRPIPGASDGATTDPTFAEAPWPLYSSPSRPFAPHERGRRSARRRRRYAMFLKRTVRARQAARSATIQRAAWATVLVTLGLIFAILTASVSAAAGYYQSEHAQLAGMQRNIAAKDSVRIFDSKGVLLYQLNDYGAQHSIQLAEIPVSVVNATISIEDHDFWNNSGVDFISIARAAVTDLQSHHVQQGGSTITQQLIKSQVLNGDVNFQRKLNEAILSIGITSQGLYSKRQIIEMYLNSIPYSPTAYGIDAAAHEYFGYQDDPATGTSAAQHLDLAQASFLAGIPQNPNLNDPLIYPEHAAARHKQVLDAMVQYGYITKAQEAAALKEAQQPNFFHPNTQEQNLAPHFVYYVRNILDQLVSEGQLKNLSRSGLNVYTTLDLDMQNHVQQAMKDHLYGNDHTDYADGRLIRNSNLTNAAAVLADQHTGALKVLLGSVDYYSNKIDGKFDVATQGYRGPGSSFKPIAYATAFEKGWFPAMTISDTPTSFWDEGSQTTYKPLDFDTEEFRGEITLRTALQFSLNIPAIKVIEYAGVDSVKANATRMGIAQTVGTWGLSSVLGAIQITPLEMVQAYTVFANYGQYIPLHAIDQITNSSGDVIYQYHVPQPVQVLSPQVAYMITSVLTDNPARADDFGGCSPLYLDPGTQAYDPTISRYTSECAYLYSHGFTSPRAWPAAAKTGTGQDFKDDWTMGYTMQYTMGVWAGNNNSTPMVEISGVTGAAPIWYNSMLYAEQNLPKLDFPVPTTGLQRARYCSNSVCTTDWFLSGQIPPDNSGSGPGSLACITEPDTGGWEYSSPPHCVGHIRPVHY